MTDELDAAVATLAAAIVSGEATREGAIYGLAARHDLEPRTATRLLDLAVEALTAQE